MKHLGIKSGTSGPFFSIEQEIFHVNDMLTVQINLTVDRIPRSTRMQLSTQFPENLSAFKGENYKS